MARLRRHFASGTITDNPLTAGATSINSANFATLLPAVASPDIIPIVLDPLGTAGVPEIAYVTAHTAASTTITALRGQETALGGSAGRQHAQGIPWIMAETAQDDRLRMWADPGAALAGSFPAAGLGPWLVQASTVVGTTDGSGVLAITFPRAFPNGLVSVVAVQGGNTVNNAIVGVSGGTASGFNVVAAFSTGAAVASALMRFNWIAIGF